MRSEFEVAIKGYANMADNQALNESSLAVHKHLEIMQGVISRMAENSRSCKVWCVTLVAATLVLVARTGKADHALIAVSPVALFYVLDAYYLMLERRFRHSYNSFVAKVHVRQVATSDLYSVVPAGSAASAMFWQCFDLPRCYRFTSS